MWGEGVCPGQGTCVPVCVLACVCVSVAGPCISVECLRLRPGLDVGATRTGVPSPGSGGGVQPPRRSKCLAIPSPPGLLRKRPARGGPGVARPWEGQESGGAGGGPGPRAGRGLGVPARLTSGDSLNRAGSARGSAFLEETERGPRQRHRPVRAPARGPRRRRAFGAPRSNDREWSFGRWAHSEAGARETRGAPPGAPWPGTGRCGTRSRLCPEKPPPPGSPGMVRAPAGSARGRRRPPRPTRGAGAAPRQPSRRPQGHSSSAAGAPRKP